MNYLDIDHHLDQEFIIDGRVDREEELWWNPEERQRNQRPGAGILAPILAEELHDPNHSLFSVNITGSPNSAPPSSSPSESEIRAAVPHPNAYFCPKHNGWVILCWKSAFVTPPLARSCSNPLPDLSRRQRIASCTEDAGQPFGKLNRTHHFHKYERAVDSNKLTPSLGEDELETLKQKGPSRKCTIVGGDEEREGILLDLYVCCQCTLYCVASGVISGVIPKTCMEELLRDRKSQCIGGWTAEQAVAITMETILVAIENRCFRGENRSIKVFSPGFQIKVGWNPNVELIFEILGFTADRSNPESFLRPPSVEPSTPRGNQNRKKLLRAWVELSAWISDFKRVNAQHFIYWKTFKLYVQLYSAREMYQNAIGARHDQIPHGGVSDDMITVQDLDLSWNALGLTVTTYSPELVGFSYLAQCRCDPRRTPFYFSHLSNIVKAFHEVERCPSQLMELLATEQSRGRFTVEDVGIAATTLGFGADNISYDGDIPDEFVENAWKECVKRSLRDQQHGAESRRYATESFRILAEFRGSVQLRTVWENERGSGDTDGLGERTKQMHES